MEGENLSERIDSEESIKMYIEAEMEKGRTVLEIMQDSINIIQNLTPPLWREGDALAEDRRYICLYHLSVFDKCTEILRGDKEHLDENLEEWIGSTREKLENLIRKIGD